MQIAHLRGLFTNNKLALGLLCSTCEFETRLWRNPTLYDHIWDRDINPKYPLNNGYLYVGNCRGVKLVKDVANFVH